LVGGGVLLFVVVAIPAGLLISCSGRMSDQQHKRGVVSHIHGGPVSNGKIVFLRYGDGHIGDVYVMNADGSKERNLTRTTAHSEDDPVFSPDGQKIAFIRIYNDLYVMNSDGSGETHLTDDGLELAQLSWSPDGKKIAFIRSDVAGFSDIYVINADGTGETKLTTTLEELDVHVGTPLWSPDGKKIAFERNAEKVTDTDTSVPASAPVEEMSGIYVMNADGTDLHKLPNTSGSSYSPAWSPDGKKIAFTEIPGHYDDIYVMNADGTGQTNLTNSPHTNEGRPAWSPDGEKIAFVEVGGGTGSGIYVMNADGTGRTRLTDTGYDPGENDGGPIWSPDGQKIAFTAELDTICVINADGTDRSCLAKGVMSSTGAWWARG